MHHRASKELTLGILGGGQLGQLLHRQAQQWGLTSLIYERQDWQNEQNIRQFVGQCDIVLLENEFIPPAWLKGATCYPNLESYTVFRDKLLEKELALKVGLRTPRFATVENPQQIQTFLKGNSGILKARTGGYDGYGNLSLDPSTPVELISAFLARGECIIEERVSFQMEVAVVVARSEKQCVAFPVAETIQSHHICHQVIAPARLAPPLLEKIRHAAITLVEASQGLGIFGVEFFVTEDGHLLYNETAPRPHNSAHFTLDACAISQFGVLIQIATGLPLRQPELKTPFVGMLNLLGTAKGDARLQPLAPFLEDGALWMYGKTESRPGRKMGHYTYCASTPREILDRFNQLQEYQV